ncbi:DNA-directed RNA polymerase subunit alpha [Candidatus Dependentiae bacterium]|nr:DNA-directed RNA polymerase subunit alpha [Candidatus Dependentiae bacterium]MCC7415104.1 DNA-directed RNA polymerase subunit alpha [Campylobacterota bacterium]
MDSKEYRPLTVPKLSWNKKLINVTFGELTAQPLEPGFGITLGNALRRALLGGVEGSAVTSIVIKGVTNEFSPLTGVVEDAMQVILNIKEIIIRNTDGKPGSMRLRVTGAGQARVADIQADSHLELINKDHVIANVADGGELDIEMFVETGRGYRAAQWPVGQALQEDNRIYLDAMFSPIRKVTFDVEKTRVGGEIDYDRLILRVHTDGSENPVDVVHYAVSVLRSQLEHFLISTEIPFNEISAVPVHESVPESSSTERASLASIPVDFLLKPIDELELSVRAHNCLINAGIKRVIDLVNLSEDEGLKIKNFGRKSLTEVKESMKAFGLSFGMNIKEKDLQKMLNDAQMSE